VRIKLRAEDILCRKSTYRYRNCIRYYDLEPAVASSLTLFSKFSIYHKDLYEHRKQQAYKYWKLVRCIRSENSYMIKYLYKNGDHSGDKRSGDNRRDATLDKLDRISCEISRLGKHFIGLLGAAEYCDGKESKHCGKSYRLQRIEQNIARKH